MIPEIMHFRKSRIFRKDRGEGEERGREKERGSKDNYPSCGPYVWPRAFTSYPPLEGSFPYPASKGFSPIDVLALPVDPLVVSYPHARHHHPSGTL